jgi:anti-anti-sigma factor
MTTQSDRIWSHTLHVDDGVCTVALAGELDLSGADSLRRLLLDALGRDDCTAVVADLADVTFLDSAGLGALVGAYRETETTGHRFTVTNPMRGVRRILEIAGVLDLLTTGRPA